MTEKTVVVVVVEGFSDMVSVGTMLKEYFSSAETQFVIVNGDITSKDGITPANVITKLKLEIDKVKNRYGYQWKDIVRIIHIADTDGTFAKDCVVKADVKAIQYFEDHMESSNVEATKQRNKNKAEVMFKLYSTNKINGINYRLYFNSCNLEHVLYNALKDFSDDEKEEMSDAFAEKYKGHLSTFINFISDPEIAVPGTYRETWKFIEKDMHSLQRHTNMHLIFDFVILNVHSVLKQNYSIREIQGAVGFENPQAIYKWISSSLTGIFLVYGAL